MSAQVPTDTPSAAAEPPARAESDAPGDLTPGAPPSHPTPRPRRAASYVLLPADAEQAKAAISAVKAFARSEGYPDPVTTTFAETLEAYLLVRSSA